MKKLFFPLLIIGTFCGCYSKRIEITSEYIINENWRKQDDKSLPNYISIERMKVRKDSFVDPISDLSQSDILNKLEIDSSFICRANVNAGRGKSYKNRKINFNQRNGFSWALYSRAKGIDSVETIGVLQSKCWYRFFELGLIVHPYYVYIYVDSAGQVHRFDVNLANY